MLASTGALGSKEDGGEIMKLPGEDRFNNEDPRTL
jgi:hypothetical protein